MGKKGQRIKENSRLKTQGVNPVSGKWLLIRKGLCPGSFYFVNSLLFLPCLLFAGDTLLAPVHAIKDQPLYSTPGALLPERYLAVRETLLISGMQADSSGKLWAHVRIKGGGEGWIVKEAFKPFTSSPEPDTLLMSSPMNTDRQRRYRILRENPDWPRRIQAAVREGAVCLGMTPDQLTASWGDPVQKGKAFMIGAGNYDVWFYKGSKNDILVISIAGNKVTGWSVK